MLLSVDDDEVCGSSSMSMSSAVKRGDASRGSDPSLDTSTPVSPPHRNPWSDWASHERFDPSDACGDSRPAARVKVTSWPSRPPSPSESPSPTAVCECGGSADRGRSSGAFLGRSQRRFSSFLAALGRGVSPHHLEVARALRPPLLSLRSLYSSSLVRLGVPGSSYIIEIQGAEGKSLPTSHNTSTAPCDVPPPFLLCYASSWPVRSMHRIFRDVLTPVDMSQSCVRSCTLCFEVSCDKMPIWS
jgi:hypothetical protein